MVMDFHHQAPPLPRDSLRWTHAESQGTLHKASEGTNRAAILSTRKRGLHWPESGMGRGGGDGGDSGQAFVLPGADRKPVPTTREPKKKNKKKKKKTQAVALMSSKRERGNRNSVERCPPERVASGKDGKNKEDEKQRRPKEM